jgi:hypothetical protein
VVRVAADDDSLDRFVVARYVPRGIGSEPEMEDIESFDSQDEAIALRSALMASAGRDSPYIYTVGYVQAGSLRGERNGQVVMEAFHRGEDFRRLPEYLDLPPNIGFLSWSNDPNPD